LPLTSNATFSLRLGQQKLVILGSILYGDSRPGERRADPVYRVQTTRSMRSNTSTLLLAVWQSGMWPGANAHSVPEVNIDGWEDQLIAKYFIID